MLRKELFIRRDTMKKDNIKKLISFALIIAMLFSLNTFIAFAGEASDIEWYNFRNNPENNGIVSSQTPISGATANLKWAEKYGTGWAAAPTPPLILDGYLYIGMSNKIVKIDKDTGEKVAESDAMVGNVGYAMNPITYADGKLFVQVGSGIIQAVDYETLKCVWSTEKIGGQTLCPISYVKIDGKGYIYTGTWQSEVKDGAYMCFSTDDSNVNENKIKKAEWRFIPSGQTDQLLSANIVYEDTKLTCDEDLKAAISDESSVSRRGFYWAGAYACEKYIAVGTDDGTREGDYKANACFYTLDPVTGEVIDKISGIKGDIRTTVVYNEGNLYFGTKGGLVYKVAVDSDGKLSEVKNIDLGNMVTASPLVYNGKIYIGVCSPQGQFAAEGHKFAVISTEKMELLYDLPIKGYPQAAALLSTAYENEDFDGDGKADGRVYIYFTYNNNPGGICYTYDAEDKENSAAKSYDLFIPDTAMQNYCISTICSDKEGTLYYKNDSGYLMAVEANNAYISNIEVEGAKSWSNEFSAGKAEYEVVMATGTEKAVVKLSLPEGMKAEVNGEAYDEVKGNTVEFDSEGRGKAEIKAICGADERTYTVNFRGQSSECTLSGLKVNNSNAFSGAALTLTPEFSSDKTEYTVDIDKLSKSFYNIWPDAADANSTVKVYAVENVDESRQNADGTVSITAVNSGHNRYAIYPADADKSVKIKIEVISENEQQSGVYTVTLQKYSAEYISELENYINPDDYGKEQQEQAADIISDAEAAISSAVSMSDAKAALKEAEEKLDSLYTLKELAEAEETSVSVTIRENIIANEPSGTVLNALIKANEAVKYGYTKPSEVKTKVTVLDGLVALHREMFGEDYENSPEDYLVVSSSGWVKKIFGVETSNMGFFVNNKMPLDEVTGYGTTADRTVLNNGDVLTVFMYNDEDTYSDMYMYFDTEKVSAETGEKITLTLNGAYAMGGTHSVQPNCKVQILDKEGTVVLEGVTDDKGQVSFIINNEGEYNVKVTETPYEYYIMPVCEISVSKNSDKQNQIADSQDNNNGQTVNTGDSTDILMLLSILALFGSTAAFAAIRRREE